MSRSSPNSALIRQFQSEAEAADDFFEPLWARATVLILAALFGCLVLTMCFTSIDRVVVSLGGKAIPTSPVNVLQALTPSIIKTLNVREGEQVRKGQLLATLDPTFAEADVRQLRLQIVSLETLIARDEAELAGTPLVYSASSDPDFARYAGLQKALYEQRIAQYQAQINSFDSKIKLARATIAKLKGDTSRYVEREDIAKKIESMRSILAEHGTGSQLNMLLSQDQRLELLRTLENGRNALVEAEEALAATVADREAFIQQWSTALSQENVKARNDLDAAKALYDKAIRRQDLVQMTANEDSVVLTIAKLSVGSVLKEGDTIFTLMPVDMPMEAETKIASRDIGFLRVGDRCTLKIDAFNYQEHGTAQGVVKWISEGAFTADENGQPAEAYYKARCSIDKTSFVNVPTNFRILPGMTLTADMNVGSRSVAAYLLHGVLRGFNEAMREP